MEFAAGPVFGINSKINDPRGRRVGEQLVVVAAASTAAVGQLVLDVPDIADLPLTQVTEDESGYIATWLPAPRYSVGSSITLRRPRSSAGGARIGACGTTNEMLLLVPDFGTNSNICGVCRQSVRVHDDSTDVLTCAQVLVALVDLLQAVLGSDQQLVELELTGVVET